MSMGPSNEYGEQKVSVIARIKHDVKRAIQIYFDKPLHYIFYTSLALLMIALLFGVKVHYPYYIILALLAVKELSIISAFKKRIKKK